MGWAPLRGQDGGDSPAPFVYDLGDTSGLPWPGWLTPVAAPAETTLNEVAYDVVRPPGAPSPDLALTLVFDEGSTSLLRVFRQDGKTPEMVAENLAEGTGQANQRTLLLHGVGTGEATRIVIQSDGPVQPLRRLVWEWPRPETVGVVGDTPVLFLRRAALAGGDASGQPLPSPRPDVDADSVSMPLLDRAVRVAGIASFGAELEEAPARARIAAKVLGLPLDRQLDCWVNGRRIGTLAAVLPPLRDPAYLFPTGRDAVLASWRDASLYVPASAWRDGENQIEFRPVPGEDGDPHPYALKDVVLELAYQAPVSSPDASPQPRTPTP